jgi:hypothetical protein
VWALFFIKFYLTFYIQIINITVPKLKKQNGMKRNVAAIDGVPGIMPGIVTVPFPEFEDEEPKSIPQSMETNHTRRGNDIPRHKRRMMPCNKKNKD